jgi:hypothetical protein
MDMKDQFQGNLIDTIYFLIVNQGHCPSISEFVKGGKIFMRQQPFDVLKQMHISVLNQ